MKGVSITNARSGLIISLSYYMFWVIVVSISTGGQVNNFYRGASVYSWQVTFVTFTNLLLHWLVIPFIRIRTKKGIWIVLLIVCLLLLMTVGFKYWNQLGTYLSIVPKIPDDSIDMDFIVKSFLFQFFGLAYFASINFFLDSFNLKLKNKELAIEKKTAELSYLKSQTNPHFLFNTLNNIYLLTRDKSDLAPDTVLRSSDILRYMLYETESDLVPVDKEIIIIEDYLELEKIRYDASLQLNFTKEIDNIKQDIPPLLMIPLIENAFKHGVSETVDSPFININLSINNDNLLFTVENSTDIHETAAAIKENIGIRNLRRQLELLFTEHELTIETREQSFFARMFINLRSYAKN